MSTIERGLRFNNDRALRAVGIAAVVFGSTAATVEAGKVFLSELGKSRAPVSSEITEGIMPSQRPLSEYLAATLPPTLTSTPAPTVEVTGTPTPAKAATVTATKTATAVATATAVSKEFPKRIEIGHFGEYTKGIELQEAAQFIENGTSEKPLLNLKISDPTSILWATGSINRGTISAIESSKPISAFSLFDNCQVFSNTEFGILLNRGGINKPIIVVTTPEELAKMDPKMSPSFAVVIPGTGDIMYREIVIIPIRASLPKTKWLKMPGEIVNRGEDFVSIEGHFVFSYTDHFKNGTRVTKGHLTDFAQIQNQPIYLNS